MMARGIPRRSANAFWAVSTGWSEANPPRVSVSTRLVAAVADLHRAELSFKERRPDLQSICCLLPAEPK